MGFVSLVLVFVLTTYTRLYVAGSSPDLAGKRTIPAPTEIQGLWGAYTPYFPVSLYESPPRKCKINQVSGSSQHFGCHNRLKLRFLGTPSGQHRGSIRDRLQWLGA